MSQNSDLLDLGFAVEPLLAWYERERRILPWREDPTPYHVWISEIMLQQTRVDTVIDYYHRFLARFPDIPTLAQAPLDDVLRLWQGLGYYRRCESLHRAAKIIVTDHGGLFPVDYGAVLKLPGIGRYTAAAILSIGFDLPYAVVDGNVLRVVTRLTARDDIVGDESFKRQVERELNAVIPTGDASRFNQGLMDLGATLCLPNGEPLCHRCPWQKLCKGRDRWRELPRRKEKKPRKLQEKTVFLLFDGDAIALRKRPSEGLLANLWEFPNVDGYLDQEDVAKLFDGDVAAIGRAKHIFTHREWHMRGYAVRLYRRLDDATLIWVKKDEIGAYAIPSAFAFFKKEI